jgi:hypothetical protein
VRLAIRPENSPGAICAYHNDLDYRLAGDATRISLFAFARVTPLATSNQSMKANGPVAKQLQSVRHDTLPWLISVSLGHMNAVSRYLD